MEAIENMKKKFFPPTRMDKPLREKTIPSCKGKEKVTEQEEEDLANLRQGWHNRYQDIMQGVPNKLPPLRAVNHEINLVDPDKKYMYYLPHCPATVRNKFQEKLNRYVNVGW
jgi:hypothetical protein